MKRQPHLGAIPRTRGGHSEAQGDRSLQEDEMKRAFSIVALVLLILPLLVLLPIALGMAGFLSNAGTMERGAAKGVLTGLLTAFSLAVLPGFLGLIFLGVSVDGMEYRPKWLFWWMLVLGVLWLLYFPAGSMVGIALLLYTIANRKKFGDTHTEQKKTADPKGWQERI
mgnify:CR=1 FL=1